MVVPYDKSEVLVSLCPSPIMSWGMPCLELPSLLVIAGECIHSLVECYLYTVSKAGAMVCRQLIAEMACGDSLITEFPLGNSPGC